MELRNNLGNHISSAQEPLRAASRQVLSEAGQMAKKALKYVVV